MADAVYSIDPPEPRSPAPETAHATAQATGPKTAQAMGRSHVDEDGEQRQSAARSILILTASWLGVFLTSPDITKSLIADYASGSHQMHAAALPAALFLYALAFDPARKAAIDNASTRAGRADGILGWGLGRGLGWALACVAGLLMTIGRASGLDLVSHVGLALGLIAITALIFGPHLIMRSGWMASLVTLAIAPTLPVFVGILTAITASLSDIMLRGINLFGAQIIYEREGMLFETAVGIFRVAEACAGFSQLVGFMIIATLLARLRFARDRARLSFIALAAGLGILANAIRVAIIIAWSVMTDTMTLAHNHETVGLFIFAIALGGLTGVALFAGRAQPLHVPAFAPRPRAIRPAGLLLLLFAGLTSYAYVVIHGAKTDGTIAAITPAGWAMTPLASPGAATAHNHADHVALWQAQGPGGTVTVRRARISPDRAGARIAGYDTARAFDDFSMTHAGSALYLFDVRGRFYRSPFSARAAIMRARLTGIAPSGQAIFIAGAPDDIARFQNALARHQKDH